MSTITARFNTATRLQKHYNDLIKLLAHDYNDLINLLTHDYNDGEVSELLSNIPAESREILMSKGDAMTQALLNEAQSCCATFC